MFPLRTSLDQGGAPRRRREAIDVFLPIPLDRRRCLADAHGMRPTTYAIDGYPLPTTRETGSTARGSHTLPSRQREEESQWARLSSIQSRLAVRSRVIWRGRLAVRNTSWSSRNGGVSMSRSVGCANASLPLASIPSHQICTK